MMLAQGQGSTHKKNGGSSSWCGCPGTVNNANENHTSCPICLAKFNSDNKIPMGLPCGHTICYKCTRRLYPNDGVNVNHNHAVPNIALLTFLECPAVPLPSILEPDCLACIFRLRDIAVIIKSHVVSRAIHRKVMNLITSITWNGQTRVCRAARGVGERVLIELVTSCSHLSHYHAQQQLWAAIRARACQFMGPAMQEEALKLVLLALEDGSALSRKVLVMFVVQRLAPQFPQASKTSIGHVIQLLYRASCFDVLKRPDTSSLMTLRPEFRNYEALRKEHDAQIVKIALESGIRFSPEQWSSILYGDSSHKPHMQSIIDKLLAPQSFTQMTTEFLVNIQRLTDVDDANFLYSIHPHFQMLASIDLFPESPPPSWGYVSETLEAVANVLIGLVSFNPKTKSSSNSTHSNHHHLPLHQSLSTPEPRNISSRQDRSLVRKNQMMMPTGGSGLRNDFEIPFANHNHNIPPPPPPAIPISNGYNNGFQSSLQDQATQQDGNQINELLAESRLLRAKMKQLQDKIPPSAAETLEQEVAGLEEEASRMIQKINIR